MGKRYKLLQPLPDCDAGTIGEFSESENAYKFEKTGTWVSPHRYLYYSAATVTQSPGWFELVKARMNMKVLTVQPHKNGRLDFYEFKIAYGVIPDDQFPLIKEAIEKVINKETSKIEHFWEQEIEKCINSPYYFATKYLTVDGKLFITSLKEEDFNSYFLRTINKL